MQTRKTPIELFPEAEIVIADTGDRRAGCSSRESRRGAPIKPEENKGEADRQRTETHKTNEDGKEVTAQTAAEPAREREEEENYVFESFNERGGVQERKGDLNQSEIMRRNDPFEVP